MASKNEDPRVAGNLVLDTVLTLVAFVVFFLICRPHVPSEDPLMINLWGAFTGACMAGVFWFAMHCFKVTLRAQREAKRARR
ncbi:hypothetical protein [Congregicoccus parvus]|uniref:hypothetical protein n=1 Tax=Congregicoccus parvus TaxID=3081749 RepID=UPI003FA5756E